MAAYYPDLLKHSYFRAVDWRWRRAEWLVAHGRYFSRRRDDDETGRAVGYLRAVGRGRPDAAKQFPDVHAARRLKEPGGQAALLVQARLLARQTSADIARLTGVVAEVIDAYHDLFFDCREHLDARDWVLVRAVGRKGSAMPDPGVVLRSFAYHGGPLVLDAVLSYVLGGKSLSDPPPDLSTASGREEQTVRLAVATHLLPQDAATGNKLHRIMPILLDRERRRAARRPPAALLADDLDSRLAELPAGAPDERVAEEERPRTATVGRASGQSA